MNEEYCIIYGSTDMHPGLFIVGVSKDQDLINGFREEHYHFAKYGEIVNDCDYDDYKFDYEISYKSGHYITPIMITAFCDYLTAIYNQMSAVLDVYERNIEYLKFNENDEEIVSDGLQLLHEHLEGIYPIELADVIDDSIYGSILNIELCLDNFMNNYEPKPYEW